MWNNDSCALGIVAEDRIMEIYGINHIGTVTLHGWFGYDTVLSILAQRSAPCVISVEENSLPSGVIEELRSLGHAVMVSSSHASAKTLCERGMRWVNEEESVAPAGYLRSRNESLHLHC